MISETQLTSKDFNIENVQIIVAAATKSITLLMVQSLIEGLTSELTPQGFAEKHINVKIDEEVSSLDEKTSRVFHKLYQSVREHIKTHSKNILEKILEQIGVDSSKKLVSSFTLAETEKTVNELKEKEPKSLDHEGIWSTE